MLRVLYALVLAFVAAPALAASPTADPAGHWMAKADGVTMFGFDIVRTKSGWSGVWVRPTGMDFDGDTYSGMRAPIVSRVAFAARRTRDGVELSFTDPRPNATPDVFLIRAIDARRASATTIGVPFEPIALVRAPTAFAPGPFDPAKSYTRVIERTTNAEMTAIFAADQAARMGSGAIDWAKVGREDDARLARTAALLDAGELDSGDDYYHAAFLFQHSGKPDDYLKAHLLAIVAVARGKPAATWIAAATLDRYLQSIKQPQVLGTQFITPKGKPSTQEPYDRRLVSNAMRAALRVPPIAEQDKQRIEIDARSSK